MALAVWGSTGVDKSRVLGRFIEAFALLGSILIIVICSIREQNVKCEKRGLLQMAAKWFYFRKIDDPWGPQSYQVPKWS